MDDIVAREGDSGVISPVAMHPASDKEGRPVPGTLVFDTDDGKLDITALVPDEPRTFEDMKAFHEWAVKTLNAQVVEREGGPAISIDYSAPSTLRYDRGLDDLVIVDDPVAAIIGGTAGYVIIGDEQVCTSRTAPCAREAGLAPPPEEQRRTLVPWIVFGTTPSGSLSIMGTTWIAHSSFVEWGGSNTFQTAGGISFQWAHCGPLDPSWCWVRKGANFLSTSYIARNPIGGNFAFSGSSSGFNTYGVMASKFILGLFPFPVADGTCAMHGGSSNNSSVSLKSGFYAFANNCP